MGDAISHAVLPGLVLAFVLSGSMNIVPLFIGAAAVGLLTTFLTQTLHQYGRVPTDASMGVVFTSLFALGVVLLKTLRHAIHFDVDCVFEGMLAEGRARHVRIRRLGVAAAAANGRARSCCSTWPSSCCCGRS